MAYQYDTGMPDYHSEVTDGVHELLPEVDVTYEPSQDVYRYTFAGDAIVRMQAFEESATLTEYRGGRATGARVELQQVHPSITAAVIIGMLAALAVAGTAAGS